MHGNTVSDVTSLGHARFTHTHATTQQSPKGRLPAGGGKTSRARGKHEERITAANGEPRCRNPADKTTGELKNFKMEGQEQKKKSRAVQMRPSVLKFFPVSDVDPNRNTMG